MVAEDRSTLLDQPADALDCILLAVDGVLADLQLHIGLAVASAVVEFVVHDANVCTTGPVQDRVGVLEPMQCLDDQAFANSELAA